MRLMVAATVLATACQITPSNSQQDFVVAYTLTGAAGVTCDSVKYENALGDIITVPSPALPWGYAYSGPRGSALQTAAWMTASGSGQQAKLKATWTMAGVSTAGDSSYGVSTAAGKFTLQVSRRRL
jgi:hypothetical protein